MSSNNTRSGGTLTIDAWNTETIDGQSNNYNSFDCKASAELYQHFLRQEPIPVLLLIDKQAKWNQELENVYLISCSRIDDTNEHYQYELRPDD
jgi:hypothetical protein